MGNKFQLKFCFAQFLGNGFTWEDSESFLRTWKGGLQIAVIINDQKGLSKGCTRNFPTGEFPTPWRHIAEKSCMLKTSTRAWWEIERFWRMLMFIFDPTNQNLPPACGEGLHLLSSWHWDGAGWCVCVPGTICSVHPTRSWLLSCPLAGICFTSSCGGTHLAFMTDTWGFSPPLSPTLKWPSNTDCPQPEFGFYFLGICS